MKPKYLLFYALILWCFTAFSQSPSENFPPPEVQPVVEAFRASGAINVDGRLNESDWSNGHAVEDFFRREPRQGGPIKYTTSVKFLFDESDKALKPL